MNYGQHYQTKITPQREPIPGKQMVKNSAGGYVFAVDDWRRLERFLILGSEGGSYYVKEKKLTIDNAEAVLRCIKEDGVRVVNRALDISLLGSAPKNDPALFVLAMCAGLGNKATRRCAFRALSQIARIGTHLFHFIEYVEGFRGWGRGLREAVAKWYNEMPLDKLQYQVIKYQQRDGWSHRDLIRLAHPNPAHTENFEVRNDLYRYIVKGETEVDNLSLIEAFEQAKEATAAKEIIKLIEAHNLTREMIPTKWLNSPDVWAALLARMPLTALIRNLGKMTSVGLLKPLSDEVSTVCETLGSQSYIKQSRLHPLSILVALKVYQQGHGMRGSLKWDPVHNVADALDAAFYLAFDNIEPIDNKVLIGVDVSGSMGWAHIAGLPLTPAEAATAMAMAIARKEKRYHIVGFDSRVHEVALSSQQRLDDAMKAFGFASGSTNCALPILAATKKEVGVDTFIIITDNETWSGQVHPVQALQEYRKKSGRQAKLITIGMTSSGFTIADPNDRGMLDVVGFDTATPGVINDFSRE